MRFALPAPPPPVVLLLAGTLALSACSSAEELDVDGFAPGACQDMTSTLLDVDETLRGLADEDLEAAQAGDRFQAAQERLKPFRDSADAAISTSVSELVTRMGFFRVSLDTGTYDDAQDADVRTALDALAQDCRGA